MSTKKKPEYPPLPEGAVLLGRGGSFNLFKSVKGFLGYSSLRGSDWECTPQTCNGTCTGIYYAVPADSEIAQLNGLGPKPKPAKRETYWLPTARSPWAVIEFRGGEWHLFMGARTRKGARGQRRKSDHKTRVVRAMIPLR